MHRDTRQRRDLRRIYRLYGFRPFALPSIAFLVIAVLFDQYAGEFATRREEANRLAAQLDGMRAKVAQQERFERVINDGRADYARMSGRAFSAQERGQAQGDLQAQVANLLRELYAESVSVSPVGANGAGGSGIVAVEASFVGVPQQLARLQTRLTERAQAMRIVELQVAAGGEGAGTAERIRVKAVINAWFARNEPTEAADRKRADKR